MDNNNIKRIKTTLAGLALSDKLQKKEARTLGLMLEAILLGKKLTAAEEDIISRFLGLKRLFKKYQSMYEIYETSLEREFAETIIKDELLSPKIYPMYKRYEALIKNEIGLACMHKKDRVLFIGSGPFPISAILLNRLSGCVVDCYEKKKKHADISAKVISRLKLDDRIRIIRRRGECLINDKYSVIIIALLAKPKKEIVERISKTLPDNIKVICRTSHGIRRAFYEPTDSRIYKRFRIVAANRARGNQTISSLLMQKKT